MKRARAWEYDQKAYDLRAQASIVIDVGQCNCSSNLNPTSFSNFLVEM